MAYFAIVFAKATFYRLKALDKQGYISNQYHILEDSQLTDLCKANDELAQKALYDKYANKMMRTCLRYLNNEMEAEDAMVDGFVKVFSKIGTFEYRGKGSLEGWIKRIMVNESLMLLRKRKMDQVEIEKVHHLANTQESIESQMMEETIVDIIKELPNGYRTVFNMYVIEGYSHKEIGEKLNISENTSKSQLSKARASLSKSLTKIGAL